MNSPPKLYLEHPVGYLEPKDFTSKLNLKNFNNKTCIIMVQANYCGYCTSAKQDFQQFAIEKKNDKKIECLTIQCDEESNGEQMLKIVKKLKPEFQGFPDYLLFKNNNLIKKEINGRDITSLEKFIET